MCAYISVLSCNYYNSKTVTFRLVLLGKVQYSYKLGEALESVMCDVLKIRLKRRDATRIKKLQLKFGNPSFKTGRYRSVLIFSGWFPFPFLVAILLFRRIFMTSHMTLSSASC